MKKLLLYAALLTPGIAGADGSALSGPTGLLTVPTAEVQEEGTARVLYSRHNSLPAVFDDLGNYVFSLGFAPGLELGGRVADEGCGGVAGSGICDLSFLAKYQFWKFDNGLALAVGGQDIGGEARNFRSRYAVATLPWHTLNLTAGYGWGPDLLDGTLGGIEWRPWKFLGVYAEYDAAEVNSGLKLQSPPLWGGSRVGANVGYREDGNEVEGGIEFSIPLGRKSPGVIPSEARVIPSEARVIPSEARDPLTPSPSPAPPLTEGPASQGVRGALEVLGFESVRTGSRPDGTLLVSLENRRYNHSSADGIGLALGTIATSAPAQVERIELRVSAYGVPQIVVATSAQAYRDFLRDGVAPENLLDIRYTDGAGADARWHNSAVALTAGELMFEPVLRTFVATEYGIVDVGLGARARLTAPLAPGVVGQFGFQVPLLLTDDFHSGENFAGVAPEAGLDLMLVQYAHKLAPSWNWLWSVGQMQVFRTDLRTLGLEQAWNSPEGRHRLHAKTMVLDSGEARHNVALAGYTWFDAGRRYSVGLTGGRFYANDSGVRLDVSRYFGDTIAGLFLKVEAEDNMAGGFLLSLPLTPRRDAAPRTLQVKGSRRWVHSLSTTLNLPDGTNALKPLLLYDPIVEFDLRRDFLDSGRLGPEYLRGQLPRMREAWLLWGRAGGDSR